MEIVAIIILGLIPGYFLGRYLERKDIIKWLKNIHYNSTVPVRLFPLHIVKRIEEKEHEKL